MDHGTQAELLNSVRLTRLSENLQNIANKVKGYRRDVPIRSLFFPFTGFLFLLARMQIAFEY